MSDEIKMAANLVKLFDFFDDVIASGQRDRNSKWPPVKVHKLGLEPLSRLANSAPQKSDAVVPDELVPEKRLTN